MTGDSPAGGSGPPGLPTRPAVLEDREDTGAGTALLRFRPETPLAFLPGQYVTLGFPRGNRRLESPFSLCSAPGGDTFEVFAQTAADSPVSAAVRELRPGAVISVSDADGDLLLDPSAGSHLCVATGTGVGPFVAAARSRAPGDRPMLLVHACRTPLEPGSLLGFLQGLAEADPGFHYVPTVSRPWNHPEWTGETGRVEEVLRKHADALGFTAGATVAYLCGNLDSIHTAEGALRRAGFDREHIRTETYLDNLRRPVP